MDSEPKVTFSPFAPLLVLLISVIVVLTWNVAAAVQQRMAGVRITDQQIQQMTQAVEVEGKLRQIMADLVLLAGKDPEAAAITRKYSITFNSPAPAKALSLPAGDVAPAQPAADAQVPAPAK